MNINQSIKERLFIIGKYLLILVFAISLKQWPLYISNQNTYFLHGLANAGVGYLNLDWQAQTADPFPLFSTLVEFTILFFGENAFYLFQIVIQGIYIYSILGIGSYVFRFNNMGIKYLSYFVLLAVLYSGLLARLLELGLWHFSFVVNPNELLTRGVAGQGFTPFFQPSIFGMFIVLSIYTFLRDKAFIAIICLIIAAVFHSSYLLSAAILTCTYMAIIVLKDKNYRKALLLGTIALISVIPTLIYNYLQFFPTNADIFAQAQSILVDYRIPHHARVDYWFDKTTLFKIVIVVWSIYLVRHTRIFSVLLWFFLIAMILSIVQLFTENKGLALLFPWRVSVFLVPIASSIILAYIISLVFQVFNKLPSKIVKPLQVTTITVVIACVIMLGYLGVSRTVTLFNASRVGLTDSVKFITSTFQPGNLFLIPPYMDSFRMAAKVPIFIDYKSSPYKDIEVIEWYNRIKLTKDFYASKGDTACNVLQNILSKYTITHVVLKSDYSLANCVMLESESYRDTDFVIYEVYK